MKNIRIPAHFYAFTAMIFWGMSFIWSSILLKYYQPITIILFRLLLSSAFLFFILRFFWQEEKIQKKDIRLIVLSALFNPFLYFLGENYGLKYSTPTLASVVIATIPVFSPLVAFLTVREKLTSINLVGIGISFIGVVLMLIRKDLSFETDVRGIIFLFCAVISALFYSVLLRKLTVKYSALLLIACQNLIGVILFIPLFLIFDLKTIHEIRLNGEIIASYILLSILASSLSFVFFAHSVKLIGISKTNIFSNLIPVFTAFFSFLFLSEIFSAQKIAGILLVVGGVYLSERNKPGLG